MAKAQKTLTVTVPIYCRIGGKEIELGSFEVDVPIVYKRFGAEAK